MFVVQVADIRRYIIAQAGGRREGVRMTAI
jgi:hypothetical protein